MKLFSFRFSRLLAAALALSLLSGCSLFLPVVIGGTAATTAIIATDRRSVQVQFLDKQIASKAENQLEKALGSRAHINTLSYNQVLVVAGTVPTQADLQLAGQIASRIADVKKVYLALKVGPNPSGSQIAADVALEASVRSVLVASANVPSRTLSILVENGVVYVMGIVSPIEARASLQAVSHVKGVVRVIDVLQVVPAAVIQNGTIEQYLNSQATSS